MSDVALDDIKPPVDLYVEAQARIKEWEDIRDKARSTIEDRMGESDTGTLNGRAVVKWSHVKTTRLDQSLVRGQYPDVFAVCQTTTTSRHFVIAGGSA